MKTLVIHNGKARRHKTADCSCGGHDGAAINDDSPYEQGWTAAELGKPITSCPYMNGTGQKIAWQNGWQDFQRFIVNGDAAPRSERDPEDRIEAALKKINREIGQYRKAAASTMTLAERLGELKAGSLGSFGKIGDAKPVSEMTEQEIVAELREGADDKVRRAELYGELAKKRTKAA